MKTKYYERSIRTLFFSEWGLRSRPLSPTRQMNDFRNVDTHYYGIYDKNPMQYFRGTNFEIDIAILGYL